MVLKESKEILDQRDLKEKWDLKDLMEAVDEKVTIL